MSSTTVAIAADESSLLAQIAAMREALIKQRNRAQQMWDACASPEEGSSENRAALGRFTEQLLKGQVDAVYS